MFLELILQKLFITAFKTNLVNLRYFWHPTIKSVLDKFPSSILVKILHLHCLEWKGNYELVCEEKWPCKLCAKLYQPDQDTRQG